MAKVDLFSGRLNKRQFFYGATAAFFYLFFLSWFFLFADRLTLSVQIKTMLTFVIGILWIVGFLFFQSLRMRRLHDLGQDATWWWINPQGKYFMHWDWYLKEGEEGPNKYGDKPSDEINWKLIFGLKENYPNNQQIKI